MNILVDIGHPAHVHLYRNFIARMQERGHRFFVTVKDLKSAQELLDGYGIDYIRLPSKGSSIVSKIIRQLWFDIMLIRLIRRNDIRIGIGSSVTIAHASRLTRMYSIIFDDDDDEVQPLFVRYAHPYADMLVSPEALRGSRGRADTLFYPGYHELAYLHPSVFTPDPSVIEKLGLRHGEKYFILRFTAFRAHHDVNEAGLSLQQKRELVALLEEHGRVFISSEREIEDEFRDRRLNTSPLDIHSVIAFAWMYIGDSQTMTTEASVLGTPALRCNTFAGRLACLVEEEEKYGLTYSFLPSDFGKMLAKIKELVSIDDLKCEWQRRRSRMLEEKTDVTTFMVGLVEEVAGKLK